MGKLHVANGTGLRRLRERITSNTNNYQWITSFYRKLLTDKLVVAMMAL